MNRADQREAPPGRGQGRQLVAARIHRQQTAAVAIDDQAVLRAEGIDVSDTVAGAAASAGRLAISDLEAAVATAAELDDAVSTRIVRHHIDESYAAGSFVRLLARGDGIWLRLRKRLIGRLSCGSGRGQQPDPADHDASSNEIPNSAHECLPSATTRHDVVAGRTQIPLPRKRLG